MAHLTEHLMFRSTPDYDVPGELERMGSSFNAITYEDRVLFYETFPSRFFDRVLAIEADRMKNSILSSTNIETERRVVIEEGIVTNPAGSVEEVLEVSDDEVRAFYRRYYTPSNAKMIVVGNFDLAEARAAIERVFGSVALPPDSPVEPTGPAYERIRQQFTPMEYELERESPLKTMMALSLADSTEDREAFLRYREWTAGSDGSGETSGEHSTTVTREVLPNGMRVLLFSHPDYHTVTVEGYVAAGSYFETADEPLLAILTAKVMTELAAEAGLEGDGAKLDMSAVSFNTYIEGRGLPGSRDAILDLMASIIRKPPIDQTMLRDVKRRLIADLTRKDRWVQLRAFNAASRHFYTPDHVFYAESIPAQIDAVRSYTLDDVMDFHRRTYRAADAILVVVGSFDRGRVMADVRDLFADWESDGGPAPVDVARVPMADGPERIVLSMKEASETHVLMTHPGTLRRTDPDYYAGLIANVAIGGSVLSSKLGMELRDRLGLVYEVGSVFFETTKGDGLWGISFDVDPDRADLAIDRTRDIIRRVANEGLTEEEALFHRATTRGAFIVSLSIPLALAGRILDAEFFGIGHDYIYEFGNIIDRVTPDAINRAIRDHFFADRLLTVEVGPDN